MNVKRLLVAGISGFVVSWGLLVLTGCSGSGSSTTTTPPATNPTATLSATTLTFSSAVNVATAAQTVTVTNSGGSTLNFTGFAVSPSVFAIPTNGNNCGTNLGAGSACSINLTFTPTAAGAVPGTLIITDNSGGVAGTTQTVTLNGTGNSVSVSTTSLTFSGVAVNTTSAAQQVTLSNAGTAALSVTSITPSPSASFGDTNNCGTSVAASGSCTINVTFSPTASGTTTGTLTIIDGAGTQTVSLTGSTTFTNTAQVTVNFGPNGYLGPPAASSASETLSYYNDITTTVTVCQPGSTTNCVPIPNVLVDTGSVGLRVLSSALGSVSLPQINDATTGFPLYECVQYGDLSYTWGPMQMATVQVGGETASQLPGGTVNSGIPIQVIASGTPPANVSYEGSEYANPCLVYPGSSQATGAPDDDTVPNLGTNGILGVGNFPQDCGGGCTSLANTSGQYIAYQSSSGTADIEPTPLTVQAWNPVSAFSSADTNGVSISLPSIAAAGAASATGTLMFGIGTQSNNAIPGTANVFELDADGFFASATYNGVTFCTEGLATCPTNEASGGTFIDSGSNALYVSDETSLGTSDCSVSTYDIGLYCPSAPLNLSLGLTGSNGTSTTVSIPIGNALNMFSANPTFAAFNDLGAPSCVADAAQGVTCNLANDDWDLGLPFFFERGTIFVGIYGTSTTYPNGYWAF